ncbi:MAG: SAM-dependent methyltransferase [Verrucomicrobia bacterium]|nr:SAM-dependent methyltransferase [Verrucomicrobiota bacterium]
MENAIRTAEHNLRIQHRQSDLTAQIGEILNQDRPSAVVWEVGCGHGHFLTAYAAAHPSKRCIGVDITKDRIDRGIRKRDRTKAKNLSFVHADARDFLESLPEHARFSEIFILFPDPWPKRRHHKNRIMQPDFLHAVAKRAGQGTPLCFRTDHEEYFRAAEATLLYHEDWEIVDEPWPFEHATVFQSRAVSHRSLIARRR